MNVTIYPCEGSTKVGYVLCPMGIELDRLAKEYGMHLVEVVVDNWDNDLTPWGAPGVFPQDSPFQGLASQTLETLRKDVFPEVERRLGLSGEFERDIVGISLSGLFAVWAWTQGVDFKNIASISGSFWYEGFPEWLEKTDAKVRKQGFAYLSLGDKEGETKVKAFKSVVEDTAKVEEILRANGADVVFEWTQGTHFAPMLPRLEKALRALTGNQAQSKN